MQGSERDLAEPNHSARGSSSFPPWRIPGDGLELQSQKGRPIAGPPFPFSGGETFSAAQCVLGGIYVRAADDVTSSPCFSRIQSTFSVGVTDCGRCATGTPGRLERAVSQLPQGADAVGAPVAGALALEATTIMVDFLTLGEHWVRRRVMTALLLARGTPWQDLDVACGSGGPSFPRRIVTFHTTALCCTHAMKSPNADVMTKRPVCSRCRHSSLDQLEQQQCCCQEHGGLGEKHSDRTAGRPQLLDRE